MSNKLSKYGCNSRIALPEVGDRIVVVLDRNKIETSLSCAFHGFVKVDKEPFDPTAGLGMNRRCAHRACCRVSPDTHAGRGSKGYPD